MYGKLEDLVAEWTCRKRALFDGPLMGDAVDVYRDGLQLAQQIKDGLEMLRDQIGPSTSHVSPAPACHAGDHGDPVSDTVERIDDLECLLSDLDRDISSVRRQIVEGINFDIKNRDHKYIFYHRCVLGKPYKEISKELMLSEGYCRSVVCKCRKFTAGE